MEALGDGFDPSRFTERYTESIEEACRSPAARDPLWTESLAVGSEGYVRGVEARLKNRVRTEVAEAEGATGTWLVREPGADYS